MHPQRAQPSLALASLSLCVLLSSAGASIANVGLPAVAQAFGASFRQVQWVVLAYLLAVTALVVGAGRLGDALGRRRLLLAGIALFTLACVLCGAAPSLSALVAARAVQGAGAALMMALTLALVADTIPKESAGGAMGLLGTLSAIGTALGPAIGGMLVEGFGWRAVFHAGAPLGCVTLAFAWRFLPPDSGAAGAAGGGAFDALRDRSLRAAFTMGALVAAVMMATLVVGPFYLAGALGLDAARMGLAMACGPLVSALGGVPAGRLADRFGQRPMARWGLGCMAAGCALLASLPSSLGVPGYLVPLATLTWGYALFQAANNSAMMAGAAPQQRGTVSGLIGLSRNLGLVGGASLMGGVYGLGSDSASGLRLTFAVALAAVGAALWIACYRGKLYRTV